MKPIIIAATCLIVLDTTARADDVEAVPGMTAYFTGALAEPSTPTYSSHNIVCATANGFRGWFAGVVADKVDEDDPAQASHYGCRNLNENEVVKVTILGVIYDKIADAIDLRLASSTPSLWWRPLAQIEIPALGITGYTTLENLMTPAPPGSDYNAAGNTLLKNAAQDVFDDAKAVCDAYMKKHGGSLPPTAAGCVEDGTPIDFGMRVETGRLHVIEEKPTYLYNARVEVIDGPDKGKAGWTTCWNSFAHSTYAGNRDDGLRGLQEVPNGTCMP